MKIGTSFLLLFVLFLTTGVQFNEDSGADAWNPDAGLVRSYTDGATVFSTSNSKDAILVIDGDLETAWQSGAAFPTGFLTDTKRNIFHFDFTILPSPDYRNLLDGNLDTPEKIGGLPNQLELKNKLPRGKLPKQVFLKCHAASPVRILALPNGGEPVLIGEYLPSENFSFKKIQVAAKVDDALFRKAYYKFFLESDEDFELFEIAATKTDISNESVTVDFGNIRPVGTIQTRHWAGDGTALSTKIFLSSDKVNWKLVGELDPTSQHLVTTSVEPEIPARYLKIEHSLVPRDWNSVLVWEVKAYDQFGPFGPRKLASPSPVSIREMLGVNGYWSWGTDTCSADLPKGEGPWRYAPMSSHGRNYHDMTWDLNLPSEPIDFSKMETNGTPAKDWVNWTREYQTWADAGMNVQSSLQFYRFEPEQWENPEANAFAYAKSYTSHFGPTKGNGLVCSVEAGNEPWDYPAGVYRKILLGMAKGARTGDPAVEVFPCALQAADPTAETQGIFKNYMGARITPEAAELLDGINIHAYSWAAREDGTRVAVHPEHAQSTFWEVLNAIRWRDQNMPGKKIYLSEWGWDSDGGGEDCTHLECVSEQAAASYAIRTTLIASRLGIERATWFFYGNTGPGSSLFTRSGLTASGANGFEKKKNFYALKSLVDLAGDSHFQEVVREDEQAWIYLLADKFGSPTYLVAWRPVNGDETAAKKINLSTKLKLSEAFRLDENGKMSKMNGQPNWSEKDGYQLEVTSAPVFFGLTK